MFHVVDFIFVTCDELEKCAETSGTPNKHGGVEGDCRFKIWVEACCSS